jgi:serine/threonine-protein kinase
VVPLRDYIAEGPAIAVAWMPGGTLEQMMTAPIAPARAVEIADAVLGALGEAHRLGVLHRDVKPANVLFDEAGVARLADFGVAHLGDLSVTATAGVIGTLSYMSPEQREGRPATVKSDLYGVGVMLFEMLTAQRVRVDEPPLVMPSAAHRELSGQHDALVMRLLARDPSVRPADTFEARKALGSAKWPSVPGPVVPAPRAGQHARGAASPARVTLDASGAAIDSRTGQRVDRVALDARTLARAGAFARARCRALQLVLRVDREGGWIWLESRRSASEAFALSPSERGALRAALLALHAEGCVHGRVDRAHIDRFAGEVTLAFCASPDAGATPERDLAQLAEL